MPLQRPARLLRATLEAREERPRGVDAEERLQRPSGACPNSPVLPVQIVEYNYAVENYTVDLGGGLLKYGVESGSIAAADFVAQLAGAFKVGARVMVPHLACFVTGRDPEREDVSGAITGYTSSTRYEVRFYTLCIHCARAVQMCALLFPAPFAHHAYPMHMISAPCAYRCSSTTARRSVTSGPTRSE